MTDVFSRLTTVQIEQNSMEPTVPFQSPLRHIQKQQMSLSPLPYFKWTYQTYLQYIIITLQGLGLCPLDEALEKEFTVKEAR